MSCLTKREAEFLSELVKILKQQIGAKGHTEIVRQAGYDFITSSEEKLDRIINEGDHDEPEH